MCRSCALARTGWQLLETHGAGLKIALNGDGDGAGRNKFATVFRQLRECLELYHHGPPRRPSPFAEFASWQDFKAQVDERELGQYGMHIQLVEE